MLTPKGKKQKQKKTLFQKNSPKRKIKPTHGGQDSEPNTLQMGYSGPHLDV